VKRFVLAVLWVVLAEYLRGERAKDFMEDMTRSAPAKGAR